MKKIMFGICILCLAFLIVACRNSHAASRSPQDTAFSVNDSVVDRNLKISLQSADKDTYVYFRSDQLGGNFKEGLSYHFVSDVTIETDGTPVPLEDALRDGSVSEDDILYRARMDARMGICQESAESRLGVAGYTYHYPEYSLFVTHDIYELPDGSLYPISCCDIFLPVMDGVEYHYGPYTSFIQNGTGFYNDREDWGIEFSIHKATSTGITLRCRQSGGQQIGTLNVFSYTLSTEKTPIKPVKDDTLLLEIEAAITMEGTTEFSIDWTSVYGSLQEGEYLLTMYIQDVFTQEQVHPLMKDFHEQQLYYVPFSVKNK